MCARFCGIKTPKMFRKMSLLEQEAAPPDGQEEIKELEIKTPPVRQPRPPHTRTKKVHVRQLELGRAGV